MTPDFISTYYPDLASIDEATVLNARVRLETYFRQRFTDIDTRPNSVFGDLAITPFAYMLAAHEIAMEHFMSDLDLENVARGIIYNCDFVRAFLNNFAVVDRDNLKSTGIIRLVFCNDDTYTVDRRTRYLFGADNEFTLRLPYDGPLEIKPSDYGSPSPNINMRKLVQLDETTFACDVGVVGTMLGAAVTRGLAGSTDVVLEDLSSITAVVDFELGIPEASLAKLAERTRKTFYDATLSTRSGARHFLIKEFPELTAVSPVLTGDDEQLRDVATAIGVPAGKVDIYVKSTSFNQQESQVVTLTYDVGDSSFKAKVNFLSPPLRIDSIISNSVTDDLKSEATVLVQSTDFSKAPLATAAYSSYQQYWIRIPQQEPPLATTVLQDGSQVHNVVVSYRTDPVIPVVADAVSCPDNKPVGVDLLTRGFVVADISDLTISYVKPAGTQMALATARERITDYFNSLGYDSVLSYAHLVKIMYDAGARTVVSIVPTGTIHMTLGDKILPDGVTDPIANTGAWATAVAAGLTPHEIPVSTMSDLIPDYQDPNVGTATATFESSGRRNVSYLLDADQITFEEVIQ
jgi:hypothetical protein